MTTKTITSYLIMLILMISCKGMNDNIEEYLARGETNYIGKLDSITVVGGRERIRMRWKINDDPRIENLAVFWNDRQSSEIYTIDRALIIDGYISHTFQIPEGYYTFETYHTGRGYRSIRELAYGASYGEEYRASLKARRIKDLVAYPDRVEIEWRLPSDGEQRSIIQYENSAGQLAQAEIPSNENQTLIADYKLGGELKIITYYHPEPQALDEFGSDPTEMRFPEYFELDRSGWTATASGSRNDDGGGVLALLDGNYNSWWHSPYGEGDVSLPHWIEIDMQAERTVKSLAILRRGTDLQRAVVKTRTSGGSWIDRGELNFPSAGDNMQLALTFDAAIRAQHLRLEITDSYRAPHVAIREVFITGNND